MSSGRKTEVKGYTAFKWWVELENSKPIVVIDSGASGLIRLSPESWSFIERSGFAACTADKTRYQLLPSMFAPDKSDGMFAEIDKKLAPSGKEFKGASQIDSRGFGESDHA